MMTVIFQSFPSALLPLVPELFLAVLIVFVMLAGLFDQDPGFSTFLLSEIALLATAVLVYQVYTGPSGQAFHFLTLKSQFVFDPLALILKEAICLVAFLAFAYAYSYNQNKRLPHPDAFYSLGLLAVLGAMILVSAQNLLILFLGLELMALPSYAMVALWREEALGIEAAMKYFLMGALSTALMLYGVSLVLGITQTLDLSQIAHVLASQSFDHRLLLLALAFVLLGVLLKLGVAPFHYWVPDIYEGSPLPTLTFLSAVPKFALLAIVFRFLFQSFSVVSEHVQQAFLITALASLAVGHIAALSQTHIKRLLGYASIAQGGYVLLALSTGSAEGKAAALLSLLSYGLAIVVVLGVCTLLNSRSQSFLRLADLAGLASEQPLMAFCLLVALFSLAGVPPTLGFMAKLNVFQALVAQHQLTGALIAALLSVVGLFYYLRVVKLVYFDPAALIKSNKLAITKAESCILGVNTFFLLLFGFFSGMLWPFCQSAF